MIFVFFRSCVAQRQVEEKTYPRSRQAPPPRGYWKRMSSGPRALVRTVRRDQAAMGSPYLPLVMRDLMKWFAGWKR